MSDSTNVTAFYPAELNSVYAFSHVSCLKCPKDMADKDIVRRSPISSRPFMAPGFEAFVLFFVEQVWILIPLEAGSLV